MSLTKFEKPPLVRLNLGCGTKTSVDTWDVDLRNTEGVNQVLDLNITPWPWLDRSFEWITASHIVEHLPIGLVKFCNECWRLLKPGGILQIRVPDAADPDMAWADPEHIRPYRRHSFINYLTIDGIRRFGYTERPWSILDIRENGKEINVHMMPVERVVLEKIKK